MSDVQKQFKKLDQKAMKLQHQCEKNSQYVETDKSKSILRLVLFVISVAVCGVSVFMGMNTFLENSFTDAFKLSFSPSIIISFFVVAGITSLFFMNRKFTGLVILILAIINIVLAVAFFTDRKLIKENITLLIICILLIILSLVILIKAYKIKRHK